MVLRYSALAQWNPPQSRWVQNTMWSFRKHYSSAVKLARFNLMLSTASMRIPHPQPIRSNICSSVWRDSYTRHNAAVKVNISLCLSDLCWYRLSLFPEFNPARKLVDLQSGGGMGQTLWVSWSRDSRYGVSSWEQSWHRDERGQQVQHFWRFSAGEQRGKEVLNKTVCDSFNSFNWNCCLQKARSASEPCLGINPYLTCADKTITGENLVNQFGSDRSSRNANVCPEQSIFIFLCRSEST